MSLIWWQPFLFEILTWWLFTSLLGWIVYPLVFRSLLLTPDRGLGVAKLVGLLLWTFLGAWISFLEIKLPAWGANASIRASLCALALAGAIVFLRVRKPLVKFLRSQFRMVMWYEIVFLAAFVCYLWLRSYTPDATFPRIEENPLFEIQTVGAEKWGNLAIMTSLWRDPAIPPADPWLAGHTLNYYYFSHLIWANLARFTGTSPSVAFNLGLATLFALLVSAAFSTGLNLSERRSGGFWAVFLVAFAGTPATWSQVFHDVPQYIWYINESFLNNIMRFFLYLIQFFLGLIEKFNFWAPSDVIPNTRNEFPAFNWLLGDLHAHAMGFLFLLLAISILVHLQRVREVHRVSWRGLVWFQSPTWLLLVIVMAAIWMANGWDLVVLALLGIGWILVESARERDFSYGLSQALQGILIWAIAGLLSTRFLAMFYTTETDMPLEIKNAMLNALPSPLSVLGSLGWVGAQQRTTPGQWMAFWGLFVLAIMLARGGYVLRKVFGQWLWGSLRKKGLDLNTPLFALLACGAFALAMGLHHGSAIPWTALIALAGLLSCLIALLALLRNFALTSATQWALLLGMSALALQFVPEFIYVADPIGAVSPIYQRYNTIFKLYYPAWGLAALACAIALSRLSAAPQPEAKLDPVPDNFSQDHPSKHGAIEIPPKKRVISITLLLTIICLGILGGLYPILGIAKRVSMGTDRVDRLFFEDMKREDILRACRTLDGLSFMSLPQFAPDDLALGLWMRDEWKPGAGPVKLVELSGASYSMIGRFSVITGYPSLLGWQSHEAQWRGGHLPPQILNDRMDTLDRLYGTEDVTEAREICRYKKLRWILVGSLEREKYADTPKALEKFDSIGRLVKRIGQASLYEIPPKTEME